LEGTSDSRRKEQGARTKEQGKAVRFEDLDVWKRSARLSVKIYKATTGLKDWGYRDQLTRAALSISSNIAEGFERDSMLDCVRFLGFAKGSCGEVRSQLYIGKEIGYLSAEFSDAQIKECQELSRMLAALIAKRRQFANQTGEELADYNDQFLPE
jgi:four helix bundle protein